MSISIRFKMLHLVRKIICKSFCIGGIFLGTWRPTFCFYENAGTLFCIYGWYYGLLVQMFVFPSHLKQAYSCALIAYFMHVNRSSTSNLYFIGNMLPKLLLLMQSIFSSVQVPICYTVHVCTSFFRKKFRFSYFPLCLQSLDTRFFMCSQEFGSNFVCSKVLGAQPWGYISK
jgi:hypothetical protein